MCFDFTIIFLKDRIWRKFGVVKFNNGYSILRWVVFFVNVFNKMYQREEIRFFVIINCMRFQYFLEFEFYMFFSQFIQIN